MWRLMPGSLKSLKQELLYLYSAGRGRPARVRGPAPQDLVPELNSGVDLSFQFLRIRMEARARGVWKFIEDVLESLRVNGRQHRQPQCIGEKIGNPDQVHHPKRPLAGRFMVMGHHLT